MCHSDKPIGWLGLWLSGSLSAPASVAFDEQQTASRPRWTYELCVRVLILTRKVHCTSETVSVINPCVAMRSSACAAYALPALNALAAK